MNVLIAIDSSATAQAALAAAMDREWPEGTDFRVLTVLPWKARVGIGGLEFNADLDRAHGLIDRVCTEIEDLCEDSIVVGQIDVGDPAEKILALANAWPADLIIVGSHDRNALERLFMGSVSRHVLNHAKCSVFIARNPALLQRPVKRMERVLVAVNDFPDSRAAVDAVLNAKWSPDTRFRLVAVGNPVYEAGSFEPSSLSLLSKLDVRSERLSELEAALSEVATEFDHRFGPGRVDMGIVEGDPAQRIADVARAWGADMIAVGASGERDWKSRLLGSSVSQSVASDAPCSVEVVRSNVAQIRPITSTTGTTVFKDAS
jgi:nucleotide-binding universal stress UspA family protein